MPCRPCHHPSLKKKEAACHAVRSCPPLSAKACWHRPRRRNESIRLHTFNDADVSRIRQHRGAANRLGFAAQRCYLRQPSIALAADAGPDAPWLRTVADQLKVPGDIGEFGPLQPLPKPVLQFVFLRPPRRKSPFYIQVPGAWAGSDGSEGRSRQRRPNCRDLHLRKNDSSHPDPRSTGAGTATRVRCPSSLVFSAVWRTHRMHLY